MKYVYTKGPWRELNGYVFFDYKPVEVTDNATLERLKKEVDFEVFHEVKHEVQPTEVSHGEEVKEAPAETRVLKGKECSKCHKLIPQGWYMHQKWCKG